LEWVASTVFAIVSALSLACRKDISAILAKALYDQQVGCCTQGRAGAAKQQPDDTLASPSNLPWLQVQALLMAQQRYMERMAAKEVSSAPAQPGF
jgi:hypothetical protein